MRRHRDRLHERRQPFGEPKRLQREDEVRKVVRQLVRDDLAVRLEALDGDDDHGPESRHEVVAADVSTPSQLPEIAGVGEGHHPEMARDLHCFAHQGLQFHGVERLELLEEDGGAL